MQSALAADAAFLVAAERRVGSNLLKVFAQTTPARIALVILKIFAPLSVHTPPDRP